MSDQQRAILDEVTRRLTDEGKLIEAGWRSMLLLVVPKDAPPVQVSEMRKAYFMGAQHLYASIMGVMEEGTEPTDNDMRRMELIHNELEVFRMQVTSNHPEGHA